MPVEYESKKLSIQDILERKDKAMEAKMQKIKADNELVERLSIIIEDANKRVIPIINMLRNVRSHRALSLSARVC